MEQRDVWTKHTSTIRVADIVKRFHNPPASKREFASLVNDICDRNKYSRAIECGCETGVTCMLLEDKLEKTFLDLNDDVLRKVERACKQLKINGHFLSEDMFSMSCPNKSQDIVFNSGVIEHFDKNQRIEILTEYARILDDQGTIVLAIPNHFSLPYRSAYLLKKKILRGYQWPWPPEFKIGNLDDELRATGLRLVRKLTLAKQAIFDYWDFFPAIKRLFQWSDSLINYEGYMLVFVIEKDHSKAYAP